MNTIFKQIVFIGIKNIYHTLFLILLWTNKLFTHIHLFLTDCVLVRVPYLILFVMKNFTFFRFMLAFRLLESWSICRKFLLQRLTNIFMTHLWCWGIFALESLDYLYRSYFLSFSHFWTFFSFIFFINVLSLHSVRSIYNIYGSRSIYSLRSITLNPMQFDIPRDWYIILSFQAFN